MIASPCIGLCRLDNHSGLCAGCARTSEEIALWRDLPEKRLREIWELLPVRRKQLGLNLHRLGWSIDTLRSFILDTLCPGAGAWVGGINGAIAEFSVEPNDDVALEVDERSVMACTAHGGILFALPDYVRALALGTTEDIRREIIVLVVPRGRAKSFQNDGLASIGYDKEAIRQEHRGARFYDLGLGSSSGFGLRTSSKDLISELDAALGLHWSKLLALKGAEIVRESPTRVVRNAIGRIEVYSRIPPAGGITPAGPHTHLFPDQLAKGGEVPSGIQIPDAYVPCAIYYPASQRGSA